MSYNIITAKTRHKLSTVIIENLSIWKKREYNCQRKKNCPVSSKCQTTKTLYKCTYWFSTNKGNKTDLQSQRK